MVARAYHRVKSNKGSGGMDNMSWTDLDEDLDRHLYKLWNRLSCTVASGTDSKTTFTC